jgi:hypothetical protein
MKVGDKVKYTPVMLAAEDGPAEGVVKMFEPAGYIFKMPMLVIDEVKHWIQAHECVVIEEGGKDGV